MKKNSKLKLLINPFTHIAGSSALIIGLIIIAVTIFLAQMNGIVFDGVFDVHFAPLSLPQAFIVQGIAFVCLVIAMYLAGRIFSKSEVRFIDVAGTLALARAPFILAAIIGFLPSTKDGLALVKNFLFTQSITTEDMFGFLSFFIVTVIAIVWFVVLAYNAFKVSCNIKEPKNFIVFIVAIIISELIAFCINYFVVMKTFLLSSIVALMPSETPATPPAELKPINDIAIQVAECLKDKDYDCMSADFDEVMKKGFSKQVMESMNEQLDIAFGKFEGVGQEVKNSTEGEFRLVFVPCKLEKGSFNLQCTFNKENKVCGIFIRPAS